MVYGVLVNYLACLTTSCLPVVAVVFIYCPGIKIHKVAIRRGVWSTPRSPTFFRPFSAIV